MLDMPWPQARAVLAMLGPEQAARLLRGVRADRVADLLDLIDSDLLPAVLAQLAVPEIADLVPLVPVETAVRIVTHLAPDTAAETLLALPTQHRTVLQQRLPPPVVATSGYADQAEQAVRRATGTVSWCDPSGLTLLAEVFGRPVQVAVFDWPGATFGATNLYTVIGATNWQRVAGLVILTNAALAEGLGAALREARQHGYAVDAVTWRDEGDDGVLKRTLVRLFS